MKLSNLSLKSQFSFSFMSIVVLILMVAFSYNIFSSYTYKKKSFIHEAKLQADLIADSAVAPILFFDHEGLEKSLSQLKQYEDIIQVLIYTEGDTTFGSYIKKSDMKDIRNSSSKESWFYDGQKESSALNANSYIVKKEITINAKSYGYLYLQKDTSSLNDFLKSSIVNITLFSLIVFIIMLLVIFKMVDRLISPIVKLSEELMELSVSQNYSVRLKYHSKNEIGKLYSAFNNLFHSIEVYQDSRNEALAQARQYQVHLEHLTTELEDRVQDRTKKLQNSLDILKQAQGQLVESEKMAALGSLVSGVAHEVNTPLGNAVTGGSIIKKEANMLLRSMQDGSLKKSSLEDSLVHIDETSRLLLKSLSTASELIKSFKKISVDQSVEQKREFDIVEYLSEVIKTFHNKLKQVPVEVKITAPDFLQVNSYPGDFAQIVNNFIQNSILHGFEFKKEDALISIDIHRDKKYLYFTYKDNGAGMSKAFQVKAFDPFVTTKRNAGGTGLGLNIVYNIVTQKLHGSIKLDTGVNQGVSFLIKIPID